ncbi:hypothetical protein SLEP1_g22868 [Rubroshorea leprosula]|uniref:Uncharacterized protein n=1 Tax=Rubroshorea leprosula TaxID=152421 RepID=A0AAV5JJC4_9ROSI|nr:hypothetical protein SLEP1_g22868 [Rubroshorea leprosula]
MHMGFHLNGHAFFHDGNQDDPTGTMSRDPLHISGGPVTRARAKKMREAVNGLIEQIWVDNNIQPANRSLDDYQGMICSIRPFKASCIFLALALVTGPLGISTNCSPFEVAYGFNPLTPLDLLPLPIDEQASLDEKKNVEVVKQLHQRVQQNIERRTEQYANQANKGQKKVVFEPGHWVWVHMQKEQFPAQRRSKLQPRGDGPFQDCKDKRQRIQVGACWRNPFEERGNDGNQDDSISTTSCDPLHTQGGPVTRARAKRCVKL